jgi:hypothetical protein
MVIDDSYDYEVDLILSMLILIIIPIHFSYHCTAGGYMGGEAAAHHRRREGEVAGRWVMGWVIGDRWVLGDR